MNLWRRSFQNEFQNTFDGTTSLMHHRAHTGESVLATEAKLHIQGIIMANNTASRSGGGIYLQSEMT